MKIKNTIATKPQINYIEILANDLQLDRHRRNTHISEIVEREITYLDELTIDEASKVIKKFKEWKYGEEE